MYQCSFCKREYETATERARCEIACDRELKKQAEEERKQKLSQERQARKDDIINMCNLLQERIESYYNDYCNDYHEIPKVLYRNIDNTNAISRLFNIL